MPEPEKDPEETDEAFLERFAAWEKTGKGAIAVCRVVGAKTARNWMLRHKKITAYNAKRILELQAEIPEAACPELYAPGYVTEEFGAELDALSASAIDHGLCALRGVRFGDVDASELSGDALRNMVIEHDLGLTIMNCVLSAQHPSAAENLS